MKNVFLVLVMILHIDFYGQDVEISTNINSDASNTILSANIKPSTKTFSEDNIEGSKYYESDFQIAKVYIDQKLYSNYQFIYNAYSDEIEIKNNDKNYILSKSESISVFTKTYKYQYLNYEGISGYFIIFNKGENMALALQVKKKIRKAVEPKSGIGSYIPPKFVSSYKYFIRNIENVLIPTRLKKKDILKVLINKKEEIENYVSKQKLSYKKEKDVIKIVDFYNTL